MNLLAHLSTAAASALISSAWEALVLTAAAALCLQLAPRLSARVRYATWTAVLVAVVLLPFLSSPGSGVPAQSAVVHADLRWSFAITGVWVMLSLVQALQMVASVRRLQILWRHATPVYAPPCLTSDGRRSALLCTSEAIGRPSVIGFFSPRILIPAGLYEKSSPEELDHIVLHEMEHLRRRDDWANLLQKLGLVLFPLNPALFWVERRLCLERELACDDGVLRTTRAPKAYAACLVNLAGRQVAQSRISLALGAWERRSELARRVHAILRLRGPEMKPRHTKAVLAGLVISLTAAVAELSRSPQLVTFVANPAPVAIAQGAPPVWTPGKTDGLQPVAFESATSPHATLLKVVLPEPAGPAPVKHKPRRVAKVRSTKPSKDQATPPVHPSLLTLASAEAAPRQDSPAAMQDTPVPAEPRFVLTIFRTIETVRAVPLVDENSHPYAAVPTPDGWLILKL